MIVIFWFRGTGTRERNSYVGMAILLSILINVTLVVV